MSGCLTYVGAGPGAVDLMTRAGRDALADAEVVVSDRPSSDAIVDAYAPDAERVLVGRAPGRRALDVDEIADELADLDRAGRRVVRLKSGDLFVCSRAAEEIRALQSRGVAVELVPGVSAALAAPLAAGLALLAADGADARDGADHGGFTVVAGNDDPAYPTIDWSAVGRNPGPVVVLMGRRRQEQIGALLRGAGRADAEAVAVVHGATTDTLAVEHSTVGALHGAGVPAPTTVIVGGFGRGEVSGAHP